MDIDKFLHHTNIQIRFNDIDLVGHVNNAIYQEYFDLARMEYFSAVLKESVDWQKTSLILAHICTDYRNPVRLYDQIIVWTRVALIGQKSIEMKQLITSLKRTDQFAASSSVLVAYDYTRQTSIPLPDEWISRIDGFEGGVARKLKTT